MVNLSSNAIEELKAATRGQVLLPGDSGFDDARRIWNAMIDRRPAAIVRCAGVADVRRAVAFARDNDLLLAVRGGGHNIAGSAVCDDGLVIDLSPMKELVRWYNHEHRHSAIRFVTPAQRHANLDQDILDRRTMLYEAARERHPLRWKGATRNWQRIHVVHLNPDSADSNCVTAQPSGRELKAA